MALAHKIMIYLNDYTNMKAESLPCSAVSNILK